MLENKTIKLSDYPIDGMFGEFGGSYAPEILLPALEELEQTYNKLKVDHDFLEELSYYNKNYGGRPTPLFFAKELSKIHKGAKIYLKREDLTHTGAHKFNNVMGQGLLAKAMGKNRIVAETGAGQHGVATASIGAVLGLKTTIYMGKTDIERQKPNVDRMRLLGAEVVPVTSGSQTLKDAVNEAMRDWVRTVESTHYLIGSVVGPHPFPMIVRNFQSIIGKEIKDQYETENQDNLPDTVIACVGGGSNAAGTFYPFIDDRGVELIGAEAGGKGLNPNENCASITRGKIGILHGAKMFLLQDEQGQVEESYSISAGLDYPGVGPEHSFWHSKGRVKYEMVSDVQALEAFKTLSRSEGIIPALESSHAVSLAITKAKEMSSDQSIVVTLSGRGDKDIPYLLHKEVF